MREFFNKMRWEQPLVVMVASGGFAQIVNFAKSRERP